MIERRIFIFKKTFLNVWKRRMHFLKPRRIFSVKSLKKSINVRTDKNYFFFEKKTISPMCFCLHVEDVLTIPSKRSSKKRKWIASMSGIDNFAYSLEKSPQNFKLNAKNLFSTTPPRDQRTSQGKPPKISSMSAKDGNNIFLETIFTQKPPLDI